MGRESCPRRHILCREMAGEERWIGRGCGCLSARFEREPCLNLGGNPLLTSSRRSFDGRMLGHGNDQQSKSSQLRT